MKKVYDNAMILAYYLNWGMVKGNNGDVMR